MFAMENFAILRSLCNQLFPETLDGENRTRSRPHDTFGDTSEQEALDPGVTMGGRYDHTGALLFCEANDCFYGIA